MCVCVYECKVAGMWVCGATIVYGARMHESVLVFGRKRGVTSALSDACQISKRKFGKKKREAWEEIGCYGLPQGFTRVRTV